MLGRRTRALMREVDWAGSRMVVAHGDHLDLFVCFRGVEARRHLPVGFGDRLCPRESLLDAMEREVRKLAEDLALVTGYPDDPDLNSDHVYFGRLLPETT